MEELIISNKKLCRSYVFSQKTSAAKVTDTHKVASYLITDPLCYDEALCGITVNTCFKFLLKLQNGHLFCH